MKLYALIDENSNVAEHKCNGRLAIFEELGTLLLSAHQYKYPNKNYRIVEFENTEVYDFEEDE